MSTGETPNKNQDNPPSPWDNFQAPEPIKTKEKINASIIDQYFDKTQDERNDFYQNIIDTDFLNQCNAIDQLKIIEIAEERDDEANRDFLYYNLKGNLYTKNKLPTLIGNLSPIEQLRFLPLLRHVHAYCDPYSPDDDTARWNIEDCIEQLTTNGTPLIKLASQSIKNAISNEGGNEIIAIGEDQHRLRMMFSELPENSLILKIAPDTAATLAGWTSQIDYLANKNGEVSQVSSPHAQNIFNIDRDEAFLVGAAHSPNTKKIINEKIGMNLSDISLDSQVQLLKFMTEADNGRFDKLCTTLKEVEAPLRKKLLENFIAADFGDDFGDSLLEIASSKQFSSEQVEKILDSFDSCRSSIQGITDFYQDFDTYTSGNFVKEYARAANERLTDALAAFREIAKTGVAKADLDWLGKTEFNFESALEALRYEQKSLEIINGTLSDVVSGAEGAYAEVIMPPQKDKTKRTMYNLCSPNSGYCLLYTRPEGAGTYDPAFEYGNVRRGVEASISLIANPISPFELPNPYRPDLSKIETPYTQTAKNKVSAIRLDREGRAPGQAANDPERDPISSIGMISVDLAAVGDAADTPSGKIARLFSVGNKIRSEKFNRDDFELNHNTAWFEQEKYGTSEGFKNLVDYVDFTLADLCEKHPPQTEEGFRGALRQAQTNSRHPLSEL